MNTRLIGSKWSCFACMLSIIAASSFADTHYVDINCITPTPPYTNWTTAATVIQDAIDLAGTGDTVLVGDGMYTNGGRAVYGYLTNRVAITKAMTVQSVNGATATIIKGNGTLGTGAVRCSYVAGGAVLVGFTLTNGATRTIGDYNKERSGGGVWCEVGGVVSNCTLAGNAAYYYGGGGSYGGTLENCLLTGNFAAFGKGGGSYNGTLNNCILTRNIAHSGGGACNSTLNNCTLTGNSVSGYGGGTDGGTLNNCTVTGNSATGNSTGSNEGGGTHYSTVNNCVVYYNTAAAKPNYSGGTLNYCCTIPNPGGTGNITNEPCLASTVHIAADSPCVGRGSSAYVVSRSDIDGEAWHTPPSIGADESYAVTATGALAVSIGAVYTKVMAGFELPFTAVIQGRVTCSAWDFGDGNGLTNRAYASHSWTTNGTYAVVLMAWNTDHPSGMAYTTMVSVVAQPVYYANVSNATPAYPYTSWATAATNIQQAILSDSTPGRLVVVADGVYESGTACTFASMINRIVLTDSIVVRSVNGPAKTTIRGKRSMDDSAVRCAYVGNGCVLSGFTLTNGGTRIIGDYYLSGDNFERCGGGVWSEVGGLVTNCVISGNYAEEYGGAVYSGTLKDCVLSCNVAAGIGGGAYRSTLSNCKINGNSAPGAGGVAAGSASNCRLVGNRATSGPGGGALQGTLSNCTFSDNYSSRHGGGADSGWLNNCTLVGNFAPDGGGAYNTRLNNCIIYYNTADIGPNYSGGTLYYCCTTPQSVGTGNISGEPGLVSDTHITASSVCVRKGERGYSSVSDIDGEAWGYPPSIGADEPYANSSTGGISVAIRVAQTTVTVGFSASFTALINGRVTRSTWNFGDGSLLTNRPYASHIWMTTGSYAVVLTAWNMDHPCGVACTALVSAVDQSICYVNVSNSTPIYPYTSWETASTKIQDAISASSIAGRSVLVSNGVYECGGSIVEGTMSNRIALINSVNVRSINGPQVTIIKGKGPNNDSAIRCAYVGKNCVLEGFTLAGGSTRTNGDYYKEQSGGGVWCEVGAIVSNCLLSGNSASAYGGGAYYGVLNKCKLINNFASWSGGGAIYGSLNNCSIISNSTIGSGGGTVGSKLENCILSGNSSSGSGGGACYGVLNNCALIGNVARTGGGAYNCTANNCTLSSNVASTDGGGACYGTLRNCIVYGNMAATNANHSTCQLSYCCTTPIGYGTGNIASAPEFYDEQGGNYRLKPRSPCINTGQNQSWMFGSVDLDGRTRIRSDIVDIGAYEFGFAVEAMFFLQGSYSTNAHVMATPLGKSLPARSPYAADVRTVAFAPSNTVDWALVEVLDTNRNTLASTSVFLDPQGRVTDETGSTAIPVEVSAGSYYLALRHRNHLAAMSVLPVAFTNTVVSYDFTTGPDNYLGGTNACVELEPGVWGLIAGDADGDGRITPVDREIVRRQQGMTGYLQGDLNLDGKVDGNDQ